MCGVAANAAWRFRDDASMGCRSSLVARVKEMLLDNIA
jgi:hypothetical protein